MWIISENSATKEELEASVAMGEKIHYCKKKNNQMSTFTSYILIFIHQIRIESQECF